MVIRPVGESALIVDLDSLDAVLELHAALARPPHAVTDVVPAAKTVLVAFDAAATTADAVERWVRGAAATPPPDPADAPSVRVPIRYDGADVASAATAAECSPEALVAEHLAADWRVAFTGFAPGFGYLVAADWPHRIPRLASPRTRVPAGAVGLADGFCGAYPRSTPGGWQLIGTTDVVLFDPAREHPALLAPGARVRFEAAR